MSKILELLARSGWDRLPTPHEVMGAIVVAATGAEMMDYFPPGSQLAKLCSLVVLVAAMTGIASASKRLPERVRLKLEAYERADGEMPAVEVKS